MYLDKRTAAGWQLSPLNAPLSEYVGQLLEGAEANSGETLWVQHRPGQSATTRGLYVRSAAGAYSFLGPVSLPSAITREDFDRVVAATSDYRHVVLAAIRLEEDWPFDETEGATGSLYEYSGSGNTQPILVGVSGPKGSTQLVGVCGAELGSHSRGSVYNALSSDGETIFFTPTAHDEEGCLGRAPLSAEVYARLHGSVTSPLEAETVDVSESECTEACGGESGKNFEGASENGKKVFFTSTQKLTNDAADATAEGSAVERRGCAEDCRERLQPLHVRLQ